MSRHPTVSDQISNASGQRCCHLTTIIKSGVPSCILSHLTAFFVAARSVSTVDAVAANFDNLLDPLSLGGDSEIRLIIDEIWAEGPQQWWQGCGAWLCCTVTPDMRRPGLGKSREGSGRPAVR